jgi:hypothetical protein
LGHGHPEASPTTVIPVWKVAVEDLQVCHLKSVVFELRGEERMQTEQRRGEVEATYSRSLNIIFDNKTPSRRVICWNGYCIYNDTERRQQWNGELGE